MDMQVKWKWTVPNVLSLFRIAVIPLFVLLYLRSKTEPQLLYWALGMLVLSALSDFFDGIIARRFNQISEMGKLLDPLADKLTQIAVILCVTLRHPELIWLLVICLTKEALQLVGGLLLFSHSAKVEGSHWYGRVTTALFYFTMAFIVLADYWFPAWHSVTSVIAVVLLVLLIGFMLFAFINYLRLFFSLRAKMAVESNPASDPAAESAASEEKE